MRSEIRKYFEKSNPDVKQYQVNRIMHKYFAVVLPALSKAVMRDSSGTYRDDEFIWDQDKIRQEIGRVKIDGKQIWIYNLMTSNPRTSLITETFKGNIGRLSRATLNELYQEKIMNELLDLKIELDPTRLAKINEQANEYFIVQPESLLSYITKTRTMIDQAKAKFHKSRDEENKLKTMERNVIISNYAMAEIQEFKDEDTGEVAHYLKEYWEEADTGRIYGHGLSLQRLPQPVRHALLGVCHKYDFKCCSFAVMTGLAKAINPDLRVESILEYINKRAKIRARIAKEIGVEEYLIKKVFTSLGFGAEMKNNPHNTIRHTLGEEKYLQFAGNNEFKYIYEDLLQVNKTIAEFKWEDGVIQFGDHTYNPIDPNSDNQKKRTRNQKLAWIYQAMEAQAMKLFVSLVKELTGQECLLTTHDCLYFKQKLSKETIFEVTQAIQDVFPYLTFEHEAVYPICTDQDYSTRFSDSEQDEMDHKQFIKEQEWQANGYKNNYAGNSNLASFQNETDEQYETRRHNQFLIDVAMANQRAEARDDDYYESPAYR